MRAYGYLRLSCPAAGEMTRQRECVARYAAGHGLRLAEMLVDIARPKPLPLARRDCGSRLLQLLGPGDAVITPALDSMFPSARDAVETLSRLRTDRIAVHVVEFGCDLFVGPGDGMPLPPRGSNSYGEPGRDAEQCRAFKRHLAAQAPYRGGLIPFGFNAVKGRLVPKPGEYDRLLQMLELRAEGFGTRRIAREVGLDEGRVRGILDSSERASGAVPRPGRGQAARRAS